MCFVLNCVHSFVMWDSVVYIWIVFWHLGVCIPSGQQKVGKVADIKGEAEYNIFTSIIRLSEGPIFFCAGTGPSSVINAILA